MAIDEVKCDVANLLTAVDRFEADLLVRLLDKLVHGKRGWDAPEWTRQEISTALRGHVDKGDPIDVAAYCMFLHYRGVLIAALPAESEG